MNRCRSFPKLTLGRCLPSPFIFVPYSHYDEPKTLTYFTKPICLLNADGGQLMHTSAFKNEKYFESRPALIKRFANSARKLRIVSGPLALRSEHLVR